MHQRFVINLLSVSQRSNAEIGSDEQSKYKATSVQYICLQVLQLVRDYT